MNRRPAYQEVVFIQRTLAHGTPQKTRIQLDTNHISLDTIVDVFQLSQQKASHLRRHQISETY